MKNVKYANFHSHCGASYLDGVGDAKEYIDASIERGIYSAGTTNHGNTASVLHYYDYGKKKGFPVMLGSEFYVEDNTIIFAPEEERKKLNKYYHLIVLAKNKKGYENLIKLSSLSFDPKRFYTRPRISFQDLFENKEGLLVTSACVGGPIASNIVKGNVEKAHNYAQVFKNEFGDDWFIEIETIDISWDWDRDTKLFKRRDFNPQEIANKGLIQIARDLDIPIVIGLDSHMVNKEDKRVQDVAIQTGPSSNGWHFWDTYYLKTVDEMWEECNRVHPYISRDQFELWCNNTTIIADRCKVELEFKPQLPKVYSDETDKDKKLSELIIQKHKIPWGNKVYVDRLRREIDVIRRNGEIDLIDYFFVLEDLISWCNKNNITVGPGRGSACGSLLTYALGITSIDPIKYDLLFERFLSIPRIKDGSLPDIDLDFSDPDRVKEYLRQRYGEDRVFSIGTVQQIKIKQAFTDICRVILGEEFNYFENKELSKGLPGTGPSADLELVLRGSLEGHLVGENSRSEDRDKKILEAIDSGVLNSTWDTNWNKKWREWINNHPKGREVYEIMIRILGLPRQPGIHACAIAISSEPMFNKISTSINKGVPVTQFTAPWCEYAGIIKFDILGLNTLKDLQLCVSLIKNRLGKSYDIYNIPTDDKMVFDRFKSGDTETIFQFNTNLQKHLLKEIGCDSIEDLAIVTAVARPGPLSSGVVQEYIKGKNNPHHVHYEHPIMKEVAGETYGTIIYQEQIMRFFNKVGGLTLTESEEVRRAISKYKAHLMKKYQGQFLEYTTTKLEPRLSEADAIKMWTKIEKYCAYGFNKSHAIAYAYVGYVCQFFKTHYPLEWWCSVLSNCDDEDFREFYSRVPVNLINPDINYSKDNFFITPNSEIVIPFSKIRGVGPAGVEALVKNQPYQSFDDFIERVPKRIINKGVVENLILAGCFSNFNKDRYELLKYFYKDYRKEELPEKFCNLDRMQILELETIALEFRSIDYVALFPHLFQRNIASFGTVRERMKGHGAVIGGKVISKEIKKTKKGKDYCQMSLYNNNDTITVKFWDLHLRSQYLPVKKEDIVEVTGEVDNFNNVVSINGKQIKIVSLSEGEQK